MALTLTFESNGSDRPVDETVARAAVRVFWHRLNRRLLGKSHRRYGKRLFAIGAFEGGMGTRRRLHYHAIVGWPDWVNQEDFTAICLDSWRNQKCASFRQNRCTPADGRWIDYVLKLRDKFDLLDCLDVTNLSIT